MLGQASDGYINDHMLSWRSPVKRLQALVDMNAGGVTKEVDADRQYVARLAALMRSMPRKGKLALRGFDQHYDRDGNVVRSDSEFFVPNDYVQRSLQSIPISLCR